MNRHVLWLLTALAIGGIQTRIAHAHAVGESYVWLIVEEDHLHGRFEVNVRDIREKLHIDVSGPLTTEQSEQVAKYIRQHCRFRIADTDLDLELTYDGQHTFDGYEFSRFQYRSASYLIPDSFDIENNVFCEDDRLHRNLLLLTANNKTGKQYGEMNIIMLFSGSTARQTLDLNNIASLLSPRDFIWQGVLHIWIGIDHILFLVALLLPAVLVREDGQWKPVSRFRSALWNILKIVTIFTVAHSITLCLAALEVVQLPSRLIESVIALSIFIVAVNTPGSGSSLVSQSAGFNPSPID